MSYLSSFSSACTFRAWYLCSSFFTRDRYSCAHFFSTSSFWHGRATRRNIEGHTRASRTAKSDSLNLHRGPVYNGLGWASWILTLHALPQPLLLPHPHPDSAWLCGYTLRKPSRTSFIFSYLLKRSARDFSTEFRSARACSFSRTSCCTVWWETDFSLCSSSGRRDSSQTVQTTPTQVQCKCFLGRSPPLPEGPNGTKFTDLITKTWGHGASCGVGKSQSLTGSVRPLAHLQWRPRESTFPSLSRSTLSQTENITAVFSGKMRLKVLLWALGGTLPKWYQGLDPWQTETVICKVHYSARQSSSTRARFSYWFQPEQQLCPRPSPWPSATPQ